MNETIISSAVGGLDARQGYNRDRWIDTPINLAYGQFTNAATTLYTAPSGTIAGASSQKAMLTELILCNTDTTAHTVTIYVVESGGTAADNRAIYKDYSIAAKATLIQPMNCVLESNQTIQGLADLTLKVTYRLSGKTLT